MAKKAAKKKAVPDHSVFLKLGPRMMRDLMRDFSPLADFQAAGIVGNGGGESRGFTQVQELNPTVKGSKGGLGFFQWTGMGTVAKPGRRRVFETLLKKLGAKANDYDANYEMLKTELKGSEKATIPAVRKTKNISDATKMFMVKFERPGIPHFEGRVVWSKMALAAYEAEEKKIAKDPSGT
jgi:tail lysozyme